MALVGRTYSAGSQYRYGFNGKEKSDEVYGESDTYDFGARMQNSRLGRWMSLDPLQQKYPNLSPYAYVANSPIIFIDPDGKRIKLTGTKQDREEMTSQIKRLTGLDVKLQNDGQLKLMSDKAGAEIISTGLREIVSQLLTEKAQYYDNNVVLKLVNKKEGVTSKFLDKKNQRSPDVLFDDYFSGAVDMEDFGAIKSSNAIYATFLSHVLSERSRIAGGDYEATLNKMNEKKESEFSTEEQAKFLDDNDKAHQFAKKDEKDVLNAFVTDKQGRDIILKIRPDDQISFDELVVRKVMEKTQNKGSLVFNYGGVKITITINPTNYNEVTGGKAKLTDTELTSKNGAIDP